MKRPFFLPVLAAALLLPACAAASQNATLGPRAGAPGLPLPSGAESAFTYVPAEGGFCAKLHAACRGCAAVEFRTGRLGGVCRRVERRELEGALAAILTIDSWYARRVAAGRDVGLGMLPTITFVDAEGKALLRLAYYPACEGFARVGGRYVSLWELFGSWLAPEP